MYIFVGLIVNVGTGSDFSKLLILLCSMNMWSLEWWTHKAHTSDSLSQQHLIPSILLKLRYHHKLSSCFNMTSGWESVRAFGGTVEVQINSILYWFNKCQTQSN